MIEAILTALKSLLKLCDAWLQGRLITAEALKKAQTGLVENGKELKRLWDVAASSENAAASTPEEIEAQLNLIIAVEELRSVISFAATLAANLNTVAAALNGYMQRGLLSMPLGQEIDVLGNVGIAHGINQLTGRMKMLSELLGGIEKVMAGAGTETGALLEKVAAGLTGYQRGIAKELIVLEKERAKALQQLSADDSIGETQGCSSAKPKPLPCIAVFRGLHFRRDYFTAFDIFRQTLAALDHLPAYSEQARTDAGVGPGLVEESATMQELDEKAKALVETLLQTRGQKVEVPWKAASDRYHNIIQRYINAYGAFGQELKEKEVHPLYKDLGFVKMPFVSFSFNPVHAVRYALGAKTPEEQAEQRRREGDIGEVYIYLVPLTPENVKRLNNILHLHKKKKLNIKARILNEAEVNVLGGLASINLVGRIVVGRHGTPLYDPLEKSVPENVKQMDDPAFREYETELAMAAIGVASNEAAKLGWTLQGHEGLQVTDEELRDPEFVGESPVDENDSEDEDREIKRARRGEVQDSMKKFAKTGGPASKLDFSAFGGLFALLPQNPNEALLYPENVADFLKTQNAEASPELIALLQAFDEGSATPRGNNCFLHTLHQLKSGRGVQVNFVHQRLQLGIESGAMIDLATGVVIADALGVAARVYAVDNTGKVTIAGNAGTGQPSADYAILHFGAHYVPLWKKA